jgi:chemotaxis signal transduction protein
VAKYKDMTVPNELIGVIPHMTDVDGYREELTILGQAWDLLTILGRMSGGRTDMTSTREDFRQLTEKLITSLAYETLSKTVLDITAKAQVAVDIIIRNLFERTADIGFLATDEDIRQYLRQHPSFTKRLVNAADKTAEENAEPAISKADLIQRFQEYVAKYSVYSNIILLDTEGNVVVQLDETNPVKQSQDPIIRKALTTREEYVESFTATDLAPNDDATLMYAFRVTQSNSPNSAPLGVLCLCFRFENEMEGIFNNLSGHDDWSVITLLDKTGKVISSSSPYQVPVNAQLEMVLDADYRLTKFGGRRYLAKTLETKGYQGFYGLGWKGHVMIPLDVAFESSSENILANVEPTILQSILNNPSLFSETIQNIPIEAEQIQYELDRTVWNGNITSESHRDTDATSAIKVLLWEISRTGNKTKNVFGRAIENLHETIVSTYMNDVEFLASLAIDIMDRNLYERANDCRWWALTSEFRRILSLSHINQDEAVKAEAILQYINNLYTVYTNLVLYDRNGKVIAVSNPSESRLVGQSLGESWVDTALKIRSTQDYCVSEFVESSLYQNKPTYIYNAAIQATDNHNQIVGGIGIVFDSEPEFHAMLSDALPREKTGQILNGSFAVYVNAVGEIISSTRQDLKVGSTLDIDLSLLNARNKHSQSAIVTLNDTYYAVGIRVSQGYREYKSAQDSYSNEVYALVFMELDKVADVSNIPTLPSHSDTEADNSVHRTLTSDYLEVATFYIDDHWYGVDVSQVVEAIKYENIQRLPTAVKSVEGMVYYDGEVIAVLDPYKKLGNQDDDKRQQKQIVVLNSEIGRFGLIVDKLGKIPRISNERIDYASPFIEQAQGLISAIITPESEKDHGPMLILLRPAELHSSITEDQEINLPDTIPSLEWAKSA